MSRDGAHIVFLYGPLNQERLYIAHTAGAAAVLPPVGGKYEEPGYLPEAPGEPAMLLNDDGTRLFYVLANVRDELFLLTRCGFDAFALRADQDVDACLQAFDDFSEVYQAAVDRGPLFARRFAAQGHR